MFISGSTAVDFDAIVGTSEKALFVAVDLESRFDLFEVYTRAVADVNLAVLIVHVVDELMPPRFAAKCASAEWNTPKKFRLDTPTADLARKSGEKRKADFEHEAALVTKHHMRALCFWVGCVRVLAQAYPVKYF